MGELKLSGPVTGLGKRGGFSKTDAEGKGCVWTEKKKRCFEHSTFKVITGLQREISEGRL